MIKLISFLLIRNVDGDILGTLGIAFSVDGPTLTKKILKLLAKSLSLSTIFPPIFNWVVFNEDFLMLTIFLIPSQVFFILLILSSK